MSPRSAAIDRAIDLESRVAAPNYQPIPVVLQSGRGEWLFDLDGRRYLDLMSAYSAVSHGHAHPRLIKALTDQAAQVAVTSRAYHSATLGAFLQHLTGLCGLDKALPSSGGAEAVETAIKAARRWGYRVKKIAPDQAEILVARGNFHGRSTTITGFSTEPSYRADFGPFTPGFRHFDFGDIESLRAAITENTCAVLMEPIQGEAGIVVPPDGFLAEVRALCNERRVLLILDEIQSGLGRTGRWFAYQHEGIRPDGLILGKALGGGLLPVSCFVATSEIMDLFEPGSHGSTFGGSPLAAAVALEALRVIEDEGLVARSAALGAHLMARLSELVSPLIRQVRGRGLWVGVELDPTVSAREVVEQLAQRGVLTKDTHGTVIRFAPALTISRDALDWGIDVFADTLRQFETAGASSSTRSQTLPVRLAARQASAPRATTTAGPQLMMSAPDHFEVSYRINPWMDPAQWKSSAEQLRRQAGHGWGSLKDMYERLGARVEIQAAQPGLPDLVFTANAALVLDRTALLARFRHPERREEQSHDRAFFETLRARGLIDSIVETPDDLHFEGAGDAIWDSGRGVIWTGWGQRSSRPMAGVIARLFSVPTVPLELIDPRFYHLDTCLCVLSGGDIVYYPAAFSKQARETIVDLVDPNRLIEASAADAEHLAVNSVCLGEQVVMCHASDALRCALTERGYQVSVVPLDSFNRSGGSAFCLTLRLDHTSRSSTGRRGPQAQDAPARLRRVA